MSSELNFRNIKPSCRRSSVEGMFDFYHDMTSPFRISECLSELYYDWLFSNPRDTVSQEIESTLVLRDC